MRLRMGLILVLILSFVCLMLVAPCFADTTDDDGGPANPGDPAEDAPMCTQSLDPTAGQFSEVWMIVMAMAFQLAL
jgi:hypothetical protein